MTEILKLTKVAKTYPMLNEPILSEINFEVFENQTISIIGPSGSGKSTLLNILGTLDHPDSGSVILNSKEITGFTDNELSEIRNREIGFIFQQHHLLPQCTVLENVLIPTLPNNNKPEEESNNKAKELLQLVGLENRLNHKPSELSGGEQLRTAIARALINNPKIILADEPTGSLDNKTAIEISELLFNINKNYNSSLVIVTHSNLLAEMAANKYKLNNTKLTKI